MKTIKSYICQPPHISFNRVSLGIMLVLFLLCINGKTYAQTALSFSKPHQIDSLLNMIKIENQDTSKINILMQVGAFYENTLPDTAYYYYNIALSVAYKINNKKFIASNLRSIGDIHFYQSAYSKALEYYAKSLKIFEQLKDKTGMAKCYNNIGIVHKNIGNYDKAINFYLKSLKIHEELNDKNGMAKCYNNIGNIHNIQKTYNKALDFFFQSLKIYKKIGSKNGIAICCLNIGNVYNYQLTYNKAIEYYLKSLKIFKELGYKNGLAICYNNIGGVYFDQHSYSQAMEFFSKSLKLYEEIGNKIGTTTEFGNIAGVNVKLKNFHKAIEYANKGLDIAKKINALSLQSENYETLSIAYDSLRDFKNANKYFSLFKIINDSIFNEETNKQFIEVQAKFENEKNQRDIEKLNNDKITQSLKQKQKTTIVYSISGGLILLLILGLSFLNAYRQKQSKRKMLCKVIETEEKERKRFAEDLHDGLGPLLSSIALYVNEIKSDRHENDKKTEFLNFTSELIDDAIKNTRMIANNLMPGVLNDYGLINALDAFCGKLKKTGAINVEILSDLKDKKYPIVIEITLYRVVLELINNALKHAKANNIIVEISESDKNIIVKYNDDGKGFDVEKTTNDKQKGLGLNNIVNRISSIGGRCDFKSTLGKGTTVNIDVNYKKFV